MKISIDKTYLKYSIYIILTATVLYILYEIVSNAGSILNAIMSALSGIIGLLTPFIIAFVIAYLLHPVVCWIEKYVMGNKKLSKISKQDKLKRTMSVLFTYLLVVGLFALFIYSTYAMIGGQITRNVDIESMIDTISDYAARYEEIFTRFTEQLDKSGLSEDLKAQLKGFADTTKHFLGTAINGIFGFLARLGGNLLNILLGLIVSFYLLKDVEYFKMLYKDATGMLFKSRTNERVTGFMSDVNAVVSSFIRGQLLDGLIVGILSSIGLALIGLDFPVLIGMTAGVANIIPYFGPIIGSVPAVIVGLLSGTPLKALFAVLVLVAVQQLDSIIIAPKVVGESVGLHPVFVMLSLIVGAYFGLLGMLLAVPTAGIVKLLIMRWVAYYKRTTSANS
ncbi:MAG: AI-2E family transporter [Bacillota bacterium]